jgi:putative salt-induced outer membrane protein YdiY
MDGEFGLNFTTGNTETTSLSAGLSIKQELEKWSNEYVLEGLYKEETTFDETLGEDVDTTSAQRFFGSAQGNYKLENPDHRLFIFGSYEDNRLSNFKYQATIAGGWNQKLWSDEKSSFDYSIGPGYSFSETQDEVSFDSVIIRGAMNYSYTISETAKFTQTFSTEVGSDNTKSRAESALTATISGALSMKLSVLLDHNSDVADDRDNLDTETAVTLVYSFF